MRKCRLCGSLIRRKAEFCRFCTAPQTGARSTMPNGVAIEARPGIAPHWMPVGMGPDTPTNGSGELLLPTAAEPQWVPEPVEPRDAIVVDELEAQLLATDAERATERRDYRARTMATPSLEVASPPAADTRQPDPPAPSAKPDLPPVKVIASGTASADAHTGTGNGNGNGHGNWRSHTNSHASNNSNGTSNGNGHANGSANGEIESDEHLVGFAHFPDATAAPKVRWR